MEAYRDQYATLFNNGRDVVVLAVSADADTTLQAWAREQDFPMLFGSDRDGAIGARYGSWSAERRTDDRSLFVIGPDGRIAHRMLPFTALAADAYAELGDAVRRTIPVRDSTESP